MPPAKIAENGEVTKAENEAVPAKETEIETPKDIKKLSEEVNAIQQQTLKKHPSTISRQEYIDAHEKVHQFATEVTKQNAHAIDKNGRRYTLVNVQSRNSRNPVMAYQPRNNGYYFINNDGTLTPAIRKRSHTVNVSSEISANMQRREPSSLILRSNKENEVKASTLLGKAETTPETTAVKTGQVNVPITNKIDATATGGEEPVYARVVKNRVVADPANGGANNPKRDAPTTPPVPVRMVTFDNWSIQVQNGSMKKPIQARVRPQSFQLQMHQPINTYVSKPIEKVYNNSTRLVPTWKHYERHRPRVNSNTFNDGKQRLVVHKGTLQI